MREKSAKEVSDFIEFLISQDLIAVQHGTYPTLVVSLKGKEVLLGQQTVYRREAVVSRQVAQHDPLFEALRTVRKRLADSEKVPPFVIFSDSALKDMAAKRPLTHETFLAVNGVGEHKLKKYGDVFLAAIENFLAENPGQAPQIVEEMPVKKAAKKPVANSHLDTLKLYQEGLKLQEIAAKRELSLVTIENHLLLCAEHGLGVDLAAMIPNEFVPLLEQAVAEAGDEKLKPIKELLPDEVSYFMIKAYLVSQKKATVN